MAIDSVGGTNDERDIVQWMIDHIGSRAVSQPVLRKIRPVTLAAQVTVQLREAILRGQLKPGQRLVEREMAGATGTSQVTIREALQPLLHEGLVVKKTNTASFVTELSLVKLREIVDVRLLLEPHAVMLASRNLTPERVSELRTQVARLRDCIAGHDLYHSSRADFDLHRMLWQYSANETLTRALEGICTTYFAYTSILPSLSADELEKRFGSYELFRRHWLAGVEKRADTHQELLEVVVKGKPKQVEAAVREHILAAWRWLLETGK